MIWQDLRYLAKNENKFFSLAQKKGVSDETKNTVAKLMIIIQKRTNTFQENSELDQILNGCDPDTQLPPMAVAPTDTQNPGDEMYEFLGDDGWGAISAVDFDYAFTKHQTVHITPIIYLYVCIYT